MTRKAESEKSLERRLVEEVKRRGGMAVKLTSQFHRGMPDRLIILPYHTIAFVELKSTGGKLSPLQEHGINALRAMRFSTRVVSSTTELDNLLSDLDNRLERMCEADMELRAKQKAYKHALIRKQTAEAADRSRKSNEMNRLADIFDDNYTGQ